MLFPQESTVLRSKQPPNKWIANIWLIQEVNQLLKSKNTIPAEETHEDSCGRKGLGETPECVARGGSPAARGKRNVFPERWTSTHLLKTGMKRKHV
ncbi:hypothetical protein CIL05_00625 [Virgibacillus profundi]|uniref:Uncharacterized protein n=1 Tax=Virgibacillus profundi TaxID=2024555 RepID=A0A2A2IIJ2_9BACI|nr:hypothetical protein CIL05_00625 [Virgibacillus profundi]PXY55380.1 hypothetical protein CIT14_00625 [Virgibacillus profundi]